MTKKKQYTLDRPDRTFSSIIGRISAKTPSHVLSGLLRKCPELGEGGNGWIIEVGSEKSKPKAKVTRVEVGNETRMVEPTTVKTTQVEKKEKPEPKKKTTAKKTTKKKTTKSKKKDE